MSNAFKKVSAYITPVSGFDDKPGEKGILHSVSEFDERGNMLASTTYQNGKIKTESIACAYNENNILVEETVTHHLDKQSQKRILSFSTEPHSMTERTIYTDGGESKAEVFYSSTGKPVKSIHYYDESSIESEEEYSYDDKDRLIAHSVKDGDGIIVSEDRVEYADHTRTINHREEESESHEVHHYDDKGRTILIERYDGDSLYQEETNTFDESGRVLKTILSELGTPIRERIFEYDGAGNTVLEQMQDLRYRRMEKTSRTYDEKNQLSSESKFTTFGTGESYRITFEYE